MPNDHDLNVALQLLNYALQLYYIVELCFELCFAIILLNYALNYAIVRFLTNRSISTKQSFKFKINFFRRIFPSLSFSSQTS